MRQWMKVFVLCIWTLMIFAVGNTVLHANRTVDYSVSGNAVSCQECVYSQNTSNDIERCLNYLLSSRYIDLLQHSILSHSGNSYDFKFVLRTVSTFLLHQTDYQLHKLYKLTHSTHPYMRGCIDYYIYTLERILI